MRRQPAAAALLSAFSALLLLPGCGGRDACEEAASAVCARACECGTECGVVTNARASAGVSLFADEEECRASLERACYPDGATDERYDDCTAVAVDAACNDDGSGSLTPPVQCDF